MDKRVLRIGHSYLVRIEYREKDGVFHFEMPEVDNGNTYGYQTVYPFIERTLAGRFTDWLFSKKFPVFLNADFPQAHPNFQEVKEAFDEFCIMNDLL